MSLRPGGTLEHGPFWSVFERSHIPMTLVDRDRTYVAINDAAVDLYQRPREEIVGTRATSGMPDDDRARGEALWARFMRIGELYGEKVVQVSAGRPLRVSFAAHATTVDQQWRALFVILSAMFEPGGEQLITGLPAVGSGHASSRRPASHSDGSGKRLTRREREIVERVALGRSTPQIAVDLNVSPATVRSHVRNAMVKTDAHTRAQLVALVLGNGRIG
jgi:DNA-binding CsgD family transcriptional regulator